MAVVAGIVDQNGGLRVVLTEARRLKFHVQDGERAYILPNIEVEPPLAWEDGVNLVAKVEYYIALRLEQERNR